MAAFDNCPSCFKPNNGQAVCPHCKRDKTKDKQYYGVLPAFTILNQRYLLGRVLGKGGFGVTYIAQDITSGKIRAIKEYMPSEYVSRNSANNTLTPHNDDKSRFVFEHGRNKFVEEARTLIKLGNNPIVVDIVDYFEQNNTAYLVMEYLSGGDLRKRAKTTGGKLDPEFAKTVFVTVASSLMEIHKKGILHRDLSPENIIVTDDGKIKLIDFGAARNFVSSQNKGMSILLKPGFAPPEQYSKTGNQGPWSDVYALCATFYTLVSGKPLVDAMFRYRGEHQPTLEELGCAVTKKTSDVIKKGMELDYQRRYKDFFELLNDIDIGGSSGGSGRKTPPKPPAPKPGPGPAPGPTPGPTPGGGNNSQGGGGKTPGGQSANTPAGGSQKRGLGGLFGWKQKQKADPYATEIPQPPQPKPPQPKPPQPKPPQPKPPQPQPQLQLQPYVAAVVGGKLYNKRPIGRTDVFKIGRSVQSCHYTIADDGNLSRVHCYIRYDGKNFYLCDVSSNGTFLENGKRLMKNQEIMIKPGTKFYLVSKNHMLVFGI